MSYQSLTSAQERQIIDSLAKLAATMRDRLEADSLELSGNVTLRVECSFSLNNGDMHVVTAMTGYLNSDDESIGSGIRGSSFSYLVNELFRRVQARRGEVPLCLPRVAAPAASDE